MIITVLPKGPTAMSRLERTSTVPAPRGAGCRCLLPVELPIQPKSSDICSLNSNVLFICRNIYKVQIHTNQFKLKYYSTIFLLDQAYAMHNSFADFSPSYDMYTLPQGESLLLLPAR